MASSSITRRGFAAGAASAILARGAEAPRPNILWITCEDTGPELGCYGDPYANTPNLDKLAARGMLYRHAWSNAPVCAPARTTIISGVYPTATGAEHMRSATHLAPGMRMYPQFLREAGYYAGNNAKEDYNLEKPGEVWNDSNAKAHWRRRRTGQPFFQIFNLLDSHESQIRRRPHTLVHDPAKVRIPAYHPDTPESRHDWAQDYDNVTTVDTKAGKILAELEQDGLADDTIVFFYGDHGSGMPRSKRWPYNSGLQVPMIVYIPEKFRRLAPRDYAPGAKSDRLVCFCDLAPTLLSLAGVQPPKWMNGRAFLGQHIASGPEYLYGFRGRMDERYDLVRSVRDRRYIYIRNYMPHRIYGQHIAYMFETPTTRVWHDLYEQGKLKPPQTYFWEPKPPEELYDLESDRDEVKNLAGSPEHRKTLDRLRGALGEWMAEVRDVGFLPEHEIHERSKGSSPYEVGHDEGRYPMKKIVGAAELAARRDPAAIPKLVALLADADSAVRYWAATGLLIRGADAAKTAAPALRKALADASPCVRIPAAEALARYGGDAGLQPALDTLIGLASVEENSVYVALLALNAIDALGSRAASLKEKVRALPVDGPSITPRVRGGYLKNIIGHITR